MGCFDWIHEGSAQNMLYNQIWKNCNFSKAFEIAEYVKYDENEDDRESAYIRVEVPACVLSVMYSTTIVSGQKIQVSHYNDMVDNVYLITPKKSKKKSYDYTPIDQDRFDFIFSIFTEIETEFDSDVVADINLEIKAI
jgi:hypothetical protein